MFWSCNYLCLNIPACPRSLFSRKQQDGILPFLNQRRLTKPRLCVACWASCPLNFIRRFLHFVRSLRGVKEWYKVSTLGLFVYLCAATPGTFENSFQKFILSRTHIMMNLGKSFVKIKEGLWQSDWDKFCHGCGCRCRLHAWPTFCCLWELCPAIFRDVRVNRDGLSEWPRAVLSSVHSDRSETHWNCSKKKKFQKVLKDGKVHGRSTFPLWKFYAH